jgi:NAD(P)-dependent dehydrogenase (short-subunit alcohol dehydrogenase family)
MAGCFCSSLLAELGAETIRIEPPGGDLVRTYSPNGVMHRGTGLAYLQEGRNKYHVTLDLDKEAGQEILKCLVGGADILIETYPAGVMDAWGIGYEELTKINPRLIYTSISGFGQFGPESASKQYDYDNVSQARSGIQYGTGEILPEGKTYEEMPYAVPTKAGPWIAWAASGTFGAMGILAAVYYRGVTGEGQAIDIATPEAYERLHDYALHWYADQGVLNERFGNLDTVRECAERMINNNCKGLICLVSSTGSLGTAGQINYSSSKAAMSVMPKVITAEFLRRGLSDRIRCVAVAPGYVGTAMVKRMDQKALEKILADVPIGRLIEPEEVASLVGELYRNEALSGDVFFIHGGLRLGSRG